jgi:hypothetical protein
LVLLGKSTPETIYGFYTIKLIAFFCKCSHHLILWINCLFGRTSIATLDFPETPKNKSDDMWDFTEKNRQSRKNNCSYSGNNKEVIS